MRASSDDVLATLPQQKAAEVVAPIGDIAEDVLFGVPRPRSVSRRSTKTPSKAAPAPAPVSTALPRDVERDLAELAGVETPPAASATHAEEEPGPGQVSSVDFSQRLLRVAELVTVGGFALMALAALLAARYGDGQS